MAVTRILQVFTVMDRGGSESMIMNYYRKINRDKVQFDFLVHRKAKAAFDDEIESLGGKIYRFSPINPLFPSTYYKQLRTFFNTHTEYAVVHSHLNAFSCFPLKIAAEFNIPCRIAHAHIAIDTVSLKTIVSYNEGIKETAKKALKNQLRKRIKNNATHYFSCGEKAGKWLFGEKTPFFTMNNAIDTEKFVVNQEVSAAYKKEFGIENELVIGHVGRFTTQKNHTFLLKVFANLVRKKPNCTLVLIGDGPLREKITIEAKNLEIDRKVIFTGVRTDVPKLFQMLDVFAFPSFYEGLPVTLIEAQAAGLKIFASDAITKEVRLTDDIQFLSIDDAVEEWSEHILKISSLEKNTNNRDQIIEGKYDISENSQEMEKFYLQYTL